QLHQHANRPPLLGLTTTSTRSVEPTNANASPKSRSHCRPGTGTASPNRQAPTGATASSMNRCRTRHHADSSPTSQGAGVEPADRGHSNASLTSEDLERTTGLEPATLTLAR